jgi:hypothetical protein
MPSPRIVTIRRLTSKTPLARQHARAVQGKGRRRPTIPWSAFDRTRYPAPALALATEAQTALAYGEYTAVDLFARLASAMSLHGVPLDFVLAATQIPNDEARHADYAMHMAELMAGAPIELQVDRKAIAKAWKKPCELEDLDHALIVMSAIGETLAAALIHACGVLASDRVVKTMFRSIAGDEVHHARLGWYYLSWRAPQWSRPELQRAADAAARMVVNVEVDFWQGRDAPRGSKKAARALGVLDTKAQRKVIRDVMENEILPGLDAFGLGASHAWKQRKRGA